MASDIDSPERSRARVAAYGTPAIAVAGARLAYEKARRGGSARARERAIRAASDAIMRHDRHAGTSYPDATLRYSHEVYAVAVNVADRVAAEYAAEHPKKVAKPRAKRFAFTSSYCSKCDGPHRPKHGKT